MKPTPSRHFKGIKDARRLISQNGERLSFFEAFERGAGGTFFQKSFPRIIFT
jgi:hypothetical protein